jgi:hypothetical protein
MQLDPGIEWLLASNTPSIRYLTLRNLLNRPDSDPEVQAARRQMAESGPIPAILSGQSADGAWSHERNFYTPKFTSGHWSMLLLMELAADPEDERLRRGATAAIEGIFHRQSDYLTGKSSGWTCLWANALRYSIYSGIQSHPIVDLLLKRILSDGLEMGWRCRYNGDQPCAWGVGRSLWALAGLPTALRSSDVLQAIQSASEFFLARHDLIRADYPIAADSRQSPLWLHLSFPLFYQADTLLVLRALAELDLLDHPAAQKGLNWLRSLARNDGIWRGTNPFKKRTWLIFGDRYETWRWVTLQSRMVLKAAIG